MKYVNNIMVQWQLWEVAGDWISSSQGHVIQIG